jgi:hypothetical protein
MKRKYSNYYLHTITRVNHANLHIFTMYIPPDFNAADRFNILKQLTFALDNEIAIAKGLNHFVIGGDFNINGMKEMELIAHNRGLKKVAMTTRGENELDAIFVSNSIEICHQESMESKKSDHAWITMTMAFDTATKFVEYQIEEQVGNSVIRARLKNKVNKEKLNSYRIEQGPFKDIAVLGELTKKVFIKFGKAPPKAYLPDFNRTFEEYRYIQEKINKKRAAILSEFKKGGKK